MKTTSKKLLSLLLAACMVMSMIIVPAPVANAAVDVYFENDLETDSTGFVIGTTKTDETTGNSYRTGTKDLWNYSGNVDFRDKTVFVVDFDVAVPVGGALNVSFYNHEESGSKINKGVHLTMSEATAGMPVSVREKLATGAFIRVSLVFDQTKDTFEVWYDGAIAQVKAAPVTGYKLAYLQFESTGGAFKLDNVKAYGASEPEEKETDIAMVYYNHDFESGSTSGMTPIFGSNAYGIQEGTDGNHYLYGTYTTGGTPKFTFDYSTKFTFADTLVYEFDVASNNLGSTQFKFYGIDNSGASKTVEIKTGADQEITYSGKTYGTMPNDGSFIKIAVALDMAAGKFSAWIDGEKVIDNAAMAMTAAKYLQVELSSSNGQNIMLDNLKIFEGTEPEYIKEPEPTDPPTEPEPTDCLETPYLEEDYENGSSKLNFFPGNLGAGDVAGVQAVEGGNSYAYLERQTNSMKAYYAFTPTTNYVTVSVDVASTKLGTNYIKIGGNNAIGYNEYGQLYANGQPIWGAGKTMPGDGTWVNFTIAYDYAKNTYCVWVDGEAILNNAPITNTDKYFQMELSGYGNVMFDNLKIYADHAYDNVCDTDCNVEDCTHTREITHVYSNACDADCNFCGETRTVGDHNWDAETGKCGECGIDCEHNYTGEVTTNPGCGTAGVKTYTCGTCGNTYTEPVAPTGNHTYDTNGDCTGCDAVCSHTWSNWAETKTPECGVAGEEERECSVCGKTETQHIDALKHEWEEGVCQNGCGQTHNHAEEDWFEGRGEEYCDKEGFSEYCCSECGAIRTETVAPTGHNWVNGVCVNPNCGKTAGASVGGTYFETAQEAVEEAIKNNQPLVLNDNITGTITVETGKTLVLDLNGKTVEKIVVADGAKFYGVDSSTKDYNNTNFGKVKIEGAVETFNQVDTDNKDNTYAGYVASKDADGYYSFHYFVLNIKSAVIRPTEGGFGYKLELAGNAEVQKLLNAADAIGVTVYKPSGSSLSAALGSTQFKVGEQSKTVLIRDVMKESNSPEQNAANANTVITISAYLQFGDEKVEVAYTTGKTMASVIQSLNTKLGDPNNTVTQAQKDAAKTMYSKFKMYETAFDGWNLSNIAALLDPNEE